MNFMKEIRILYVEDDIDVRNVTCGMLDELFNFIDVATNGKEGWEKYQSSSYDLVITDIKMPVMDGMEMINRIKSINSEQKIVVLSGYDEPDNLLNFINQGISNFLLKPFGPQKLFEILSPICKNISNAKSIRRYQANIDAIFQSVGDAIISVDTNLQVIEANNAVKKLCGLGRDDIINKPFQSTNCQCKCIETLRKTIKEKKPIKLNRSECFNTHRKDQVVSLSTYPLKDNNDKLYGSILVIRDETRVHALEKNLQARQKYHRMIGKSCKIQNIYNMIESLANHPTTVLITGESGTGKELVAEALHFKGVRNDKPLVKVNCSALPETLLESDLFGHVKGAFTGALKDRIGRFQVADGGTIFLDEIGDITAPMQVKLLRFLQEKEFERIGDNKTIKADVRVVTATNQNLREKVKAGLFREDLYYRLKVVELNVPSLKERVDDIPILVEHFIEKYNERYNKNIEEASNEVMNMLVSHSWPGNVRELEHVIEHAFVTCQTSVMIGSNLPPDFIETIQKPKQTPNLVDNKGDEYLNIVNVLEKTRWNKSKAAKILGIDRSTLYLKLKKYKGLTGQAETHYS